MNSENFYFLFFAILDETPKQDNKDEFWDPNPNPKYNLGGFHFSS